MRSIDILLPFYGDVGYLELAVQSVLAQTEDGWRLTVVDDGYPDPGVAAWFAGLDHPQVRYTRNAVNLGANGNYRHALTLAETDWVVVMGADDLMLPTYVATVRSLIAGSQSCAVVQPGVQVVNGQGVPVRPLPDRIKTAMRPAVTGTVELQGEPLAASLLRANWTYFPSLCWQRSLVTSIGFREGLDVVQDLALLLDVAATGATLVLGEETAFLYRRHARSDSMVRGATGARFREERAFFEAMAEECRARGWLVAERAARRHLTSRLNAASLLPSAVADRHWSAAKILLRHCVA